MGRKRHAKRVDQRGRSLSGRFVRLPYFLLNAPAYRSLSPNARALLVELIMLYYGDNNGSLYMSVRDAAARMGLADSTAASNAFDELLAMGFIAIMQEAHFSVKAADASRARCWRLLWLPGPGRKLPDLGFQTKQPEPRTRASKRMDRGLRALKAYNKGKQRGYFPVLDCGTMALHSPDLPPEPVAKSMTPNAPNGANVGFVAVWQNATHIELPWGMGAAINWKRWNQRPFPQNRVNVAYKNDWTSRRASRRAKVAS